MKKILATLVISTAFMGIAQAQTNREEVFQAISMEEDLNGYDIDEMRTFTQKASEEDLRAYLAEIIYMRDSLKDNPNELDKEDLKGFIANRNLTQLVEAVKNGQL